jgi:hypothetical protein
VAQKIQTLFIDDLDGSTAEGTVRFGLDGTEYEIDLNAGHARELRDVLPGTGMLPGWWQLTHMRVEGYSPSRRGPGMAVRTTG